MGIPDTKIAGLLRRPNATPDWLGERQIMTKHWLGISPTPHLCALASWVVCQANRRIGLTQQTPERLKPWASEATLKIFR